MSIKGAGETGAQGGMEPPRTLAERWGLFPKAAWPSGSPRAFPVSRTGQNRAGRRDPAPAFMSAQGSVSWVPPRVIPKEDLSQQTLGQPLGVNWDPEAAEPGLWARGRPYTEQAARPGPECPELK